MNRLSVKSVRGCALRRSHRPAEVDRPQAEEEHGITGPQTLRRLEEEFAELGFGAAPEDLARTAITGQQVGEVLCQPAEGHVTGPKWTTVIDAEKRVKSEVLWVKRCRTP